MNRKQLILLFIASVLMILAGILLLRIMQIGNRLSEEQIRDRMRILQGKSTVPVIPNKSQITAEVLNAERGEFPAVVLTLQVIESMDINEFSNLLKEGQIITVSPQYIYDFKDGVRRIIFSHPQNIHNFQAYYVFEQDRIRAVAEAKGGPENIVWSVTDIDRMNGQEPEIGLELSPSPVPISPNKSRIVGSVLRVRRKDYPEVEVVLRVLESRDVGDFSNFLGSGVVITAKPYYLYKEGTFIPSEPNNSRNLLAYYLLPGDTIEGEASLHAGNDKAVRNESGGESKSGDGDGKTGDNGTNEDSEGDSESAGRGSLIWIISDLTRVSQEVRDEVRER
ncbi:MAG: hypothetical protein AB1847_03915 [bacterium]